MSHNHCMKCLLAKGFWTDALALRRETPKPALERDSGHSARPTARRPLPMSEETLRLVREGTDEELAAFVSRNVEERARRAAEHARNADNAS